MADADNGDVVAVADDDGEDVVVEGGRDPGGTSGDGGEAAGGGGEVSGGGVCVCSAELEICGS